MTKQRLAGRRSPSWAFCERFVIPDYSHPDADRDYLVRWRLIQCPLFGIYLHKIETPDPRPTLHDHPWPFVAIILRGGYDQQKRDTHHVDPRELMADGEMYPSYYSRAETVRHLNVMRMDNLHWISRLHRVPTWTLVFVGRRQRVWGYLDRDGAYTDFLTHPHNAEFMTVMRKRGMA